MKSMLCRASARGVRPPLPRCGTSAPARYSRSLWIVPVTGLVFAIVLSLIFVGGVVTGPLFPEMDKGMINSTNVSRFLVWSFIAGFAERLMPDVIDRLAENAKKFDTAASK